jgi:hypothetical protein
VKTNDARLPKRIAAYFAIAGSACAISGATLLMASGTDLDRALSETDMAGYLQAAGARAGLVEANLIAWIFMVFLLASAGLLMARLDPSRGIASRLASAAYLAGAPLVLAAYVAWLSIIVTIAPDTSPASLQLATTIGWFASRADWIATILFLSAGPFLLSMAGRNVWAPLWLVRWSYAAAAAGVLNAVAMFAGGAGLSTYGIAIIPIGVGWMIVSGIALLKSDRAA